MSVANCQYHKDMKKLYHNQIEFFNTQKSAIDSIDTQDIKLVELFLFFKQGGVIDGCPR